MCKEFAKLYPPGPVSAIENLVVFSTEIDNKSPHICALKSKSPNALSLSTAPISIEDPTGIGLALP